MNAIGEMDKWGSVKRPHGIIAELSNWKLNRSQYIYWIKNNLIF